MSFEGFLVTWDVNSADAATCSRLRRFVFGKTVTVDGKSYHYAGLVERDGVRYVGQSVLYVHALPLQDFLRFLRSNGIDHVVMRGSVGPILRA